MNSDPHPRLDRRAFLGAAAGVLAQPSLAAAATPRIRSVGCLGDSISDTAFSPGAYPKWLPSHFAGVPVVVQGEAGNSTADVLGRCRPEGVYTYLRLARFPAAAIRGRPVRPAQYTFVLVGINDLLYQDNSAHNMIGHLRRTYGYLLHHGSTPCPITILPWDRSDRFRADREHVRLQVNDWIRQRSHPLIPIDAELAMGDGLRPPGLKRAFDDGDGIHPTNDGPRTLAALAARSLLHGLRTQKGHGPRPRRRTSSK